MEVRPKTDFGHAAHLSSPRRRQSSHPRDTIRAELIFRVSRLEIVMSRSSWLPLSLGLLAVALLTVPGLHRSLEAQAPAAPKITKWEYRIVRATEEILNQHGEQGWEVVSGLSDVKGQSAGMRAINTIERAILKRPKAN